MRRPINKIRLRFALVRGVLATGALVALTDAGAQIRLPNVQVPSLPSIQVPVTVGDTLNRAVGTLDTRQLRDLRRDRVRELLRANRRELEADPKGEPIVRAEITAVAPSDSSLDIARREGFSIARDTVLPSLDVRVVILSPPRNVSTSRALTRLRRADPSGSYDFNHIYIESGIAVDDTARPTASQGTGENHSHIKIGLIDTGIDRTHSSFHATTITQSGCNSKSVPAAHGTAVASLLVGHASRYVGAAPDAALYSVDVYCGKPTGGSIEEIATAFSWLVEQRVPVINVSLVGPPNVLLETIVANVLARGHIVVAAVGNDGPAAPPLYPAAYAGVIGVTGVDAKRRVLVEAGRGPHVYFSAPGADMGAAGLKDDYVAVRGTSFAAPIVAGLLARRLASPDIANAKAAIDALATEAIDLGSRGVDKVFGHGLVGENVRDDCNALLAKK